MTESSGRWDAEGSFNESCFERRDLAFKWASGLDIRKLHWMITIMASDANAFTLYERKALLEVVALRLGEEVRLSDRFAKRAQDALDREILERGL